MIDLSAGQPSISLNHKPLFNNFYILTEDTSGRELPITYLIVKDTWMCTIPMYTDATPALMNRIIYYTVVIVHFIYSYLVKVVLDLCVVIVFDVS